MFGNAPETLMIVRGYNAIDRIEYGATAVVSANQLDNSCKDLLMSGEVAYLHIRFAPTNCYQFRVERG